MLGSRYSQRVAIFPELSRKVSAHFLDHATGRGLLSRTGEQNWQKKSHFSALVVVKALDPMVPGTIDSLPALEHPEPKD